MTDSVADLPDEVRELLAPHMKPNAAVLADIGIAIGHKREEAKNARSASGIETVWTECEEAYIGIDNANRAEYSDARWAKPMSMDGPVTTGKTPADDDNRSTVFLRITARYVDAGKAKLAALLLSASDKSFSFSETPVPELIKAKADRSQVAHDGMGNVPLTRPAKPGEVPPPAPAPGAATMAPPSPAPLAHGAAAAPSHTAPLASGQATAPAAGAVQPAGAAAPVPAPAPRVPLTVADFAEEKIELARKKAKAAEARIWDWMVLGQYTAEMRKVIADSARLGVGVVKGPVPKSLREIAVTESGDDGIEVEINDEIIPAVAWCDPWNIFPDPACGENIRLGDYCFERDYLSARQLSALKDIPGYIGSQIDQVLKEGPEKRNLSDDSNASSSDKDNGKRKDRFTVWYFYGTLKSSDFMRRKSEGKEQVYAIVTLVNDCVIRATINPLDSGQLPYHSMPWQRRAGHWAGIGVGEQLKAPQKMATNACRAMLNNAGKSSGSQIVIDRSAIRPADGKWNSYPDKVWWKIGDVPGQTVKDAFEFYEIPPMTDELLKIIDFALQMAEESTSIPLITQGQSGPTTPDTLGATQLQDNNANQLLRDIAYTWDEHITEPVVRQFYELLLLDPDVPDEEKGDFSINAHGSVALVEQAIQNRTIAQMGQLVKDPSYGLSPRKWAKYFLKANRIDPAEVSNTEEEQARIDAQPPVPDPSVQVAQIKASVARDGLVMKQNATERTVQNETQIAAAAQALEGGRITAEQHKTATEATVRLHEIQLQHQRALLEYATNRNISLDKAKADLARTAMTTSTERDLNAQNNAVDLHKHANPQPKPAVQVPGRAGNGRALSQAGTAQ